MKLIVFVFIMSILWSCSNYRITKDAVYIKSWNAGSGSSETQLQNADPQSFAVLKNSSYAKDKNQVYFYSKLLEGADATTFEVIKDLYAKDKNSVYYEGEIIKNAQPNSIKIIDENFSKDEKDIYFRTNALKVCNVNAFQFIKQNKAKEKTEYWSTDGCHYYYDYFKIPSADYENVKIYTNSGGIASDSKNVYFRDRNLLYSPNGEKMMDSIDLETFSVTGYLECKDKFGCINVMKGRESCP